MTAEELLAQADALLLDFDGPVCSVFSGVAAATIAEQLRLVLADGGHPRLPAAILTSQDPFEILAYAASRSDEDGRYVEAAFTAHEVEAVASALPTEGSHDLIRSWSQLRKPLAIVSNNSVAAVEAYLDFHDLRSFVSAISARTSANFRRLKPHPYLLLQALAALGASPVEAVMIGDSVTDIEAAKSVGTRSVGYANKPGKRNRLLQAGADGVVEGPAGLTSVLSNA